MWNVIIANPDKSFISRFRQMVCWEQLGYKLTEVYEDGLDTLEAVMRDRPDLVFISGRLARMDGITVIENARRHGLAVSFIILDEQEDFALAREGMRLGVQEYLTFELQGEELEQVLRRYADRMWAVAGNDMDEYLIHTRRMLRNSFMERILNREKIIGFTIEELKLRYHFNFQEGCFQTVVILLGNLPAEVEKTFLPIFVEAVRARFDPACYEMVPYIYGARRLTLIFNYSSKDETVRRFPELQRMLVQAIEEKSGTDTVYSIGFGRVTESLSQLSESIDTAELAAYCWMLRGENRQYEFDRLCFDGLTTEEVCTRSLKLELDKTCEQYRIADLEAAVKKALAPVTASTNPDVVMQVCRMTVESVLVSGQLREENEMREVYGVLRHLGGCSSLQRLMRELFAWAAEKLEQHRKEKSFSRPVRDAQRFIRNNCTKSVTLQDTADYVHLNASYFSTLFKRETGQNYMEFLTECRIAEAKQLLRQSNLNVSQICYEVGYTDKRHFSQIFIKKVGMKPSAYRMLHG